MIKTLTVGQGITAVEISGGTNVIITNRSDDATVYASLDDNFIPDGDGVKAIESGMADIFRNVGIHTTKDGVSDWFGTLYLQSDGEAKVQLETTFSVNFSRGGKGGGSSGGGGGDITIQTITFSEIDLLFV